MDILLVFAPLTEAKHFPYLSLPMLTAYLRERGFTVGQIDLNLELAHALLDHAAINEYMALHKERQDLKQRYRNALASFIDDNLDEMKADLFRSDKRGKRKAQSESVHFLNQGIALMSEASVLERPFTSFDDIDDAATSLDWVDSDDLMLGKLWLLVKDLVAQNKAPVIGISIAFFSQIFPSIVIARMIKTLSPKTRVIFGGQQVMLRYDTLQTLKSVRKHVDGLGISMGEETLASYLDHLAGKICESQIPDFIALRPEGARPTQSKTRLHFNALPTPDFDGLRIADYFIEEIQFPLITCVGCYWGRCAFCSYGNRSYRSKSYQQASPEKVARDCLALQQRWQAHRIIFVDENTNLSLIRSSMQLFRATGNKIQFNTRNRMEPRLADRDYCQELKDLGCAWMSVGYDTNAQRLLDQMNKGIDASHYQSIVDNLHAVGIELRISLLGGLPFESDEEFRASESFLIQNASKMGIDVAQMLTVEPHTFLMDDPSAFGLCDLNSKHLQGNDELNYGQGFVGASYQHLQGNSYEQRRRRFIEMVGKLKQSDAAAQPTDQKWMRRIDNNHIADFYKQKIYALSKH